MWTFWSGGSELLNKLLKYSSLFYCLNYLTDQTTVFTTTRVLFPHKCIWKDGARLLTCYHTVINAVLLLLLIVLLKLFGCEQLFFLWFAGNLHVGRWGTQRSREGTWSGTPCHSCLSSSAAYACWAADPLLSSSSTPSLRNMGPTFSSQPPWEVREVSFARFHAWWRTVLICGFKWFLYMGCGLLICFMSMTLLYGKGSFQRPNFFGLYCPARGNLFCSQGSHENRIQKDNINDTLTKKILEREQESGNSYQVQKCENVQGSAKNPAREIFVIKHINSTERDVEYLSPPNKCPGTTTWGQKLKLLQEWMVLLAVQYRISPSKDLPVINVLTRPLNITGHSDKTSTSILIGQT